MIKLGDANGATFQQQLKEYNMDDGIRNITPRYIHFSLTLPASTLRSMEISI